MVSRHERSTKCQITTKSNFRFGYTPKQWKQSNKAVKDINSIMLQELKEDLIELKDNIYGWYAYYMYDENEFNKSIKDAYVLSIRIQVTGDEDSNLLTSKILVIKENGKWKIAVGGLDNSFYSNY